MVHHRSIAAPALRLGIAALFATVPRLFYDIEIHGLEFDPHAPRTYYAMTHKRDQDSMAPLPIILGQRGWHALTGEVHFAMRADSCTPGFLARVLDRPRWLAHLLHPLDLGLLLRAVGVHPIQGWHGRPVEEWLRECLRVVGDQPAGRVLSESVVHDLATAAHEDPVRTAEQPLSRILRWRYHEVHRLFSGPGILRGEARRQVERRALATIKGQIDDLAAWLRDGGSLYNAPEGVLSPDGRLSPITAGFHRLLRAAPTDTRIQPLAITYDFMTSARPRLFIDMAPQIERAAALPPAELDTLLRERWLRAARFSTTQLAARFLVAAEHSGDTFTAGELAEAVLDLGTTLAALGRHVDARLFRTDGARRLATGYLRTARRHGLVKRAGEGRWVATKRTTQARVRYDEVGYRDAPLAYSWNELREMLSNEPSISLPADGPAERIIVWPSLSQSAALAR